MRRYLSYIAAVAAAALAAGRLQRGDDPASIDPAVTLAGRAPEGLGLDIPGTPFLVASATPQPPAVDGAGLAAAAARLDALTAERLDALTAELAEREAALAGLRATLAQRDAQLDAMTTTLTEREAELAALRDELVAMRERYAFDLELAAIRSIAAGAAPLPPEKVETLLAAATAPAAPGPMALTEILFDSGSARLSPGGQVHAAVAAAMLADLGPGRIRLFGYADRVGNPAHNRALAEARARAVADFLVGAGVPAALIEAAGMGEDDLPVTTADGVPEPLNRTVAIIAVPPPTS
jgi:outer membrane protein OmpA-like peptidoglycan-associated protein